MLPIGTDNGGRLAAIVPTGLVALARGNSTDPSIIADGLALSAASLEALFNASSEQLPPIRSLVVVAVDGLGSANLKARAGHAPTIASLPQRRITTVTPSTTAAALTTLTTGTLPGVHGLVGYTVRHPELGIICPLRDWDGIDNLRDWQRGTPLFKLAEQLGARSVVYGRPAHSGSGFTDAVLTDAQYIGGDRIADRFGAARHQIDTGEPTFAYIYIDELDRAGHKDGWQSEGWAGRLEQLDAALADFLTGLHPEVGVVVTADHGMVDIAKHQQVILDLNSPLFNDVESIGGEPRFRAFYLRDGADPHSFAAALEQLEGKRAWVATREEVIESGVLGADVSPEVADRLGDVILAARAQCVYYSTADDPRSLDMVGQHGSWTDEERGIPLILAGRFAGSGVANLIDAVARA